MIIYILLYDYLYIIINDYFLTLHINGYCENTSF